MELANRHAAQAEHLAGKVASKFAAISHEVFTCFLSSLASVQISSAAASAVVVVVSAAVVPAAAAAVPAAAAAAAAVRALPHGDHARAWLSLPLQRGRTRIIRVNRHLTV